ncbi:hypothetical protein H109_04220 [Trichophyton interdigitale MR816]|uniref:Uncharacterized protein n=1 Tax=Trichophyton interdigitale (strain MR816) TaxID=1215338 RepID=A0A059J7T8_TRIIM|nr:hypothetical protein H109_04220 [Trichophyton interdigitale MR816]
MALLTISIWHDNVPSRNAAQVLTFKDAEPIPHGKPVASQVAQPSTSMTTPSGVKIPGSSLQLNASTQGLAMLANEDVPDRIVIFGIWDFLQHLASITVEENEVSRSQAAVHQQCQAVVGFLRLKEASLWVSITTETSIRGRRASSMPGFLARWLSIVKARNLDFAFSCKSTLANLA